MNSYIYRLTKTKEYLEHLNVDHKGNALWDVLHDASWHQKIDWVMWIENNKSLIDKIIQYEWFTEFPEDLKIEIDNSFMEIIRKRH